MVFSLGPEKDCKASVENSKYMKILDIEVDLISQYTIVQDHYG